MNVSARTVVIALAIAAAGCRSAPPARTEPQQLGIDLPTAWRAAVTAPGTPTEEWLRGFGDPTLDALLLDALAHNQGLAAAAERVLAADARQVIAGAPRLPQVDGGLGANRTRRNFIGFPIPGSDPDDPPSVTTTIYGSSLNLSWELDLWGRLAALGASASAELEASVADLSAARLSLVGQVCKAYFAAVTAARLQVLAESSVASFEATAADVRERYRSGVRPALDVQLADLNVSQARANVQLRREELARALRQLDVLAGRYPAGEQAFALALPESVPEVPAGLPAEVLQRRPDLAAAERRLAAAGCRVEAARAALYPRISLTASGGTSTEDLENLADSDFRVWSIGANLVQPLFQGGALRAEVERTEAVQRELLASWTGTVIAALAEVESALAAEALLAERERALADAARHARLAADLAVDRYRQGISDFLAVNDSQRQSFLADTALVVIRQQRIANRIDLQLALGGNHATAPQTESP